MTGRNKLVLCFAEAKRLLEIALRKEQYAAGDFEVTDLQVSRVPNGGHADMVEITLVGTERATAGARAAS